MKYLIIFCLFLLSCAGYPELGNNCIVVEIVSCEQTEGLCHYKIGNKGSHLGIGSYIVMPCNLYHVGDTIKPPLK